MITYALLVSGGTGTRMGTTLPKQFLPVQGKPVLLHTLEKFHGLADRIILVMAPDYRATWETLFASHGSPVPHEIVDGGSSRTESVRNGLAKIDAPGLVAIHDAVRPLVSRQLIEHALQLAREKGSSLPVIPLRDSVRLREGDATRAMDREQLVVVQTPQCFRTDWILDAYQQAGQRTFSDDAAVAEAAGYPIYTLPGETGNLKITYAEDLALAEALLARFL